jgi:hypothetical protein
VALIVPKHFRWKNGVIPYAVKDLDDEVHALLLSVFRRWELAVNTGFTGYHFGKFIEFVPHAWQRDQSTPILVLVRGSEETNAGCVGTTSIAQNHGFGPTFTINMKKKDYENIPHEVGHIIGLAHEHNRDESLRTPTSSWMGDGVRGDRKKSATRGDLAIGTYDVSSIMHYAGVTGAEWKQGKPPSSTVPMPGRLNQPTVNEVRDGTWRPSFGDIQGVRTLYTG